MSLSSQVSRAFASTHRTLAQIQGMAAGGTNTLLPSGETCVGVYDFPQVIEEPVAGGGYRKRTTVRLSIPRSEIIAAPAARTKIVRTDLSPNITYIVDHVDKQEAHAYLLTLVSFAG